MIDWEEQWRLHGANFKDGYVHLYLQEFNPKHKNVLKLKPGPGFGDLSHTTTRLMLQQIPAIVHGRDVLDIGCGSGILSLAALSMGATSVEGIDIDPEAIIHSKMNSQLNQMQINFSLPSEYCTSSAKLVLMNMIHSEQKVAWQSLQNYHYLFKECLTSGILAEERSNYVSECQKLGWHLLNEKEANGWMCFHFKI